MKELLNKTTRLTCLGAILLLAACGGGGGGGGGGFEPPDINETPLSITVSNQTDIATAATEGLSGTADSGDIVIGAVTNNNGSTFDVWKFSSTKLLNYAKRGLTTGADITTGVTGSDTIPCDSGKIVISYSIDDPYSDMMIAGDFITITAKSCVDNFDGTTVNGKYTMTVAAGYMDIYCDFGFGMNCPDVTLAVSFNNFRVTESGTTATIHGGFNMSVSETSGTSSFSGTSLYLIEGSDAVRLKDFSITSTELSATVTSTEANFTLASTMLNGSITITTDPLDPVLQDEADLHPYQGTIVVTGAGGATLTIDYLDATQAELTLDPDGPGGSTPPFAPVTLIW